MQERGWGRLRARGRPGRRSERARGQRRRWLPLPGGSERHRPSQLSCEPLLRTMLRVRLITLDCGRQAWRPRVRRWHGLVDDRGVASSGRRGVRGASTSASLVFLPQHPRQPEVRKDTGVGEPGHRGYSVAFEREDDQRGWSRYVRLCGRPVAPEGGLAVRTRWHEPQRRAAPALEEAEEGADRGKALVLPWPRRHRQPGVFGERGDDSVDVARLD